MGPLAGCQGVPGFPGFKSLYDGNGVEGSDDNNKIGGGNENDIMLVGL